MSEEQYGFVQQEVIERLGVLDSFCYQKDALAVAEIEKEVATKISMQLEETESPGEVLFDVTQYLQAFDSHFLLLLWKKNDEQRLYFYSDTKRVRALEFLDYLLPEFGLVRGGAKEASGRIANAILQVQMSEIDVVDPLRYFLRMANSYFCDCDCIMAGEYGVTHQNEIQKMPIYVKKQIPWAFVRSTDVVKTGESIQIKSLENESGLQLVSDENQYIMIGYRGEIYDIKREKFERTYETTEEPLDVFTQMMDILPAAEVVSNGDYVSLEELARLCYPKSGAGIYAKRLERRTKVFPVGEEQEYFLGRPGDYMAVRPDDFCDIYVIESEIFYQTYEEK